jgi:hypothetical protein
MVIIWTLINTGTPIRGLSASEGIHLGREPDRCVLQRVARTEDACGERPWYSAPPALLTGQDRSPMCCASEVRQEAVEVFPFASLESPSGINRGDTAEASHRLSPGEDQAPSALSLRPPERAPACQSPSRLASATTDPTPRLARTPIRPDCRWSEARPRQRSTDTCAAAPAEETPCRRTSTPTADGPPKMFRHRKARE